MSGSVAAKRFGKRDQYAPTSASPTHHQSQANHEADSQRLYPRATSPSKGSRVTMCLLVFITNNAPLCLLQGIFFLSLSTLIYLKSPNLYSRQISCGEMDMCDDCKDLAYAISRQRWILPETHILYNPRGARYLKWQTCRLCEMIHEWTSEHFPQMFDVTDDRPVTSREFFEVAGPRSQVQEVLVGLFGDRLILNVWCDEGTGKSPPIVSELLARTDLSFRFGPGPSPKNVDSASVKERPLSRSFRLDESLAQRVLRDSRRLRDWLFRHSHRRRDSAPNSRFGRGPSK